MHNPNVLYLIAAISIVTYLKNSPGIGLLFTKAKTMEVEIYIDTD